MVTPVIEKLLIIQDHDLRIMKFERELTDLPKRKASIESLLDEHRQAVSSAKDDVKGRQSEIKQVELDVESQREKIRKFRAQQLQLKSNREFKAMEDEIAAVEKNIRTLEDSILGIMENLEIATTVVKDRESALKQEELSIRHEIDVIDQRGESIKAELGQVRISRDKLAGEADPSRLALYNRLFANKRDRVLVPVENAACGGCHMKLPPYVCHEAKKQNVPVFCDFCSRMLY